MGLRSARSSSRDFRPSDKYRRSPAKSSPGRPLPAGHGVHPEPCDSQAAPGPSKLDKRTSLGTGASPGGPAVLGVPRSGRCLSGSVHCRRPRARVGWSGSRSGPSSYREQLSSEPAWNPRATARAQRALTAPNGSPRSLAARNAVGRGPWGVGKRRGSERPRRRRPRIRAGVPEAAGVLAARLPSRPPCAWSRRDGVRAQPMQGGRGATRPRRCCRPCPRLTCGQTGTPPPSAPDTPPPSCLPPAPALRRRGAARPPRTRPSRRRRARPLAERTGPTGPPQHAHCCLRLARLVRARSRPSNEYSLFISPRRCPSRGGKARVER